MWTKPIYFLIKQFFTTPFWLKAPSFTQVRANSHSTGETISLIGKAFKRGMFLAK